MRLLGPSISRPAADTVLWVVGQCPVIEPNGWVIGGERHSQAEKAARLAAMLDEADGVAAAEEFLRGAKSRRTVNRNRDSYGWKHLAERWHASNGHPVFISNGSFITAALAMGFYADPGRDGGNVFLNISEAAAHRFWDWP